VKQNFLTVKTLLWALLVVVFSGCFKSKGKPHVDDISIPFRFSRFEIDAAEMVLNKKPYNGTALEKKHPVFYPVFTGQVIGVGEMETPVMSADRILEGYFNDPYVVALYDSVIREFPTLDDFETQLHQSLKYVKYYFPEKPTPEVVTFVSNFTYAAITVDSTLIGIALDMHLGGDFVFYQSQFPVYLSEKFTREYMLANALKVLARAYYPYELAGNTLLDEMIYEGKLCYFTELTCADCETYQVVGMMEEDENWCRQNEPHVWDFYVEKDLVYSTDVRSFQKYVGEAPNTAGMPPEAPGNTGTWVGWQIVKAYMEQHEEVTLHELMENRNAEEILSQSGYRPRY
jgi:uncharacterized protein YjaZ